MIGLRFNKFIQSDSIHDWLGINLCFNLKHIFNEKFDFKKEVKKIDIILSVEIVKI